MDPSHRWKRLLVRQPALALTVTYLLLSGVGITYEFWFFRYFDINVLDYAQASDFLLAVLRKPLVILISLVPLGFLWLTIRLTRWSYRFSPRWAAINARFEEPAAQWAIYPSFVVLYFVLFTALYAAREARLVSAGERQILEIELVSTVEDGGAVLSGSFLGSTSQYLFLFLPAQNQTRIIPTANAAQIFVAGKQRTPS